MIIKNDFDKRALTELDKLGYEIESYPLRGFYWSCLTEEGELHYTLQKPIRRWSLEAKRRNRLNKIHKRLKNEYSIVELFHQAIQSKILENPDYYGICPLPIEFSSAYYPPYRKLVNHE
jgi:hypothetical protein